MTNKDIDVNAILELRQVHKLTYRQIAERLDIPVSRVWGVCTHGYDVLWLTGLSVRGINAVLKTGVKTRDELRHKIINEHFDLEDVEGIGHKTAFEVLKWCNII